MFSEYNGNYSSCLFTTVYYYNFTTSLVSTICKINKAEQYDLIGIQYNDSTFKKYNTT